MERPSDTFAPRDITSSAPREIGSIVTSIFLKTKIQCSVQRRNMNKNEQNEFWISFLTFPQVHFQIEPINIVTSNFYKPWNIWPMLEFGISTDLQCEMFYLWTINYGWLVISGNCSSYSNLQYHTNFLWQKTDAVTTIHFGFIFGPPDVTCWDRQLLTRRR